MAFERYSPALTGLRGVAILWVIPHNADEFPAAHDWTLPFAVIAHCGWIGVQLFFVLSGFLITRGLLATRGADGYYRAFFARRALRIFPLYFLTLIFFLLLLPRLITLSPEVLDTYSRQGWLWVFLNNWTQPFEGTVHWFSHFWSLAVEEQFYLLWPAAIATIAVGRLWKLCILLIGVALAARIGVLMTHANADMAYMYTICRMDALIAGALAALIQRDQKRLAQMEAAETSLFAASAAIIAAGALMSHVYSPHAEFTISIGYSLLACGLALVVLIAAGAFRTWPARALRRVLTLAPLRSVGQYSFAMYVFHLPIILLLGPWLLPRLQTLGAGAPLVYVLLLGGVSYFGAFVSYHLIERRFLDLKQRFVPRTSTAAG